ncbi:Crp/Fnr family transcriptional regulator [Spirosoma areae]
MMKAGNGQSNNEFVKMNTEPIIAHINRYVDLNDGDATLIRAALRSKHLKRKEWLLRAGEVSTDESFIVKGCFRTIVTNQDGFEHVLFFSVENWWAADMASFLTQTPATLSIQALEDSDILQLNKSQFDALNAQVVQFVQYFRVLLQNAFVAQQRRIVQNLSLTAQQRYETFLATYPALEQRVAQKEIASYLGITPEFLSMIRRKMAGH